MSNFYRLRNEIFLSCFLFGVLFLCCTALIAKTSPKKGKGIHQGEKTDWSEEVDFDFDSTPLYDALDLLANGYHFTFFLDRRVDTEIPVTYSSEPMPLIAALTALAESAGLEAVRIGSVFYIGPRGSGGQLLLLIEKHRKQGDAALDRQFTPSEENGYIFPADLLQSAAKHTGYVWSGLDKMPFDCWRAESAVSLKTYELISLVLIGYEVDYKTDREKKQLKPISLDLNSTVETSWSAEDFDGIKEEEYQTVTLKPIRGEIRGSGSLCEVAQIEYLVSKKKNLRRCREEDVKVSQDILETGKTLKSSESHKKISGKIRQATLREVSENLERNLGMKLLLDPSLNETGITFESRVTCEFRNCSPEEAVKIIAEELRVKYRISGKAATLFRKK